jgi:hypothetical protein
VSYCERDYLDRVASYDHQGRCRSGQSRQFLRDGATSELLLTADIGRSKQGRLNRHGGFALLFEHVPTGRGRTFGVNPASVIASCAAAKCYVSISLAAIRRSAAGRYKPLFLGAERSSRARPRTLPLVCCWLDLRFLRSCPMTATTSTCCARRFGQCYIPRLDISCR